MLNRQKTLSVFKKFRVIKDRVKTHKKLHQTLVPPKAGQINLSGQSLSVSSIPSLQFFVPSQTNSIEMLTNSLARHVYLLGQFSSSLWSNVQSTIPSHTFVELILVGLAGLG